MCMHMCTYCKWVAMHPCVYVCVSVWGRAKETGGSLRGECRTAPWSFPHQRVGFPLFNPPLPVPARKHETLTDSPGRKPEPTLLCDSHHDLQPNPPDMTVSEVPNGKLKCSKTWMLTVTLYVSLRVQCVLFSFFFAKAL